MSKYASGANNRQLSRRLGQRLQEFISPLLTTLDEHLDKRLVRTFRAALVAIIQNRSGRQGLLLSELGGYILGPEQAPAGTKRLSNLLRSAKWKHDIIASYLWQQATERVTALAGENKLALVVWDESVLEKSESIALEGLCAVRSSKARRLKRIKPGYYNPPGGRPVFVPGMQWVSLLVMGLKGSPTVAAMRWWTSRGKLSSDRRTEETDLLQQCHQQWGRQVLHVWDRGFAGAPWIETAAQYDCRFLLRWQKGYNLTDAQGLSRKAWLIARGKRSLDHRLIWDARRRCQRRTGLYYCPVTHPATDEPLYLLVSRPGRGRSPWYLLSNEPIHSVDDAWRLILAYGRRWQIEMAFRFTKTELALESPRLWSWQNRLKLLFMASLVYAFLLSLLQTANPDLLHQLLRTWCHRTGKRYREASIPLYRLRSALSRLWVSHPPPLLPLWENSG